MNQERLRQLPSVDRLLSLEAVQDLIDAFGHQQTVEALRQTLDAARDALRAGADVPDPSTLAARASSYLAGRLAPTLRPVINATGVIIHTNLGRAPLSQRARAAVEAVSRGYSTLEYDVAAGQRGHRASHVERLVCELTGAESALTVNNNAGAVLLALTGLARGQGVIISRGQLVEIGGGFRVPDVMAQSGARLIEVGTTNRTHLYDYQNALTANDDAAWILRAHHSNFRVVGFTSEPSLAELVAFGREQDVPVMDDLGSGALIETEAFGLAHEPTVQESVDAGAAVVCFSGDKLLGGPQAGVIVGQARYVDPLKTHPLARALRPDKLCLVALQETLLHYLREEALEKVPVWRMIALPLDAIAERAEALRQALHRTEVPAELVDGHSTVGGGSLPGETLPTRLLALSTEDPDRLAGALRAVDPPVIGRIRDDQLVLDPRTVLPEEEQAFLRGVAAAVKSQRP
ncbi:MAG: L-seryl-tRNA(Sec) selenium transferase [Chloroflexota bacterium]